MTQPPDFQKLLDLVARLRAPAGCPWDREQDLPSVRAYLLEEAHELAAAIDSGDADSLAEELGDLMFQTAFIGRLGEEREAFTVQQVVEGVYRKMVERHPHVFGSESLADAEAVRQAWERRKLRSEPGKTSLLEGVPVAMPALLGAYRLTQKASGVGFDWPDASAVLAKVDEELAELREELRPGPGRNQARIGEELGDLLFTLSNLARKLEIDPEAALAASNLKFRRRFSAVEAVLGEQGRSPAEASLAEMDAIWEEVKRRER